MNLTVTGKAMVFRNEQMKRDGTPFISYAVYLSKKNQNGDYRKKRFEARFRRGVEVANKSMIDIKNGWYDWREYEKDGRTEHVDVIFVDDFETIEADPPGFSALGQEELPF